MPRWDRFVCVDWSKDPGKRRAWVAEIGMRRVAPAEDVEPTLASLVGFARALPGRTVLAIDAHEAIPARHAVSLLRREHRTKRGASR